MKRYTVTVTLPGTDVTLNRGFRFRFTASRWAGKFRPVPMYHVETDFS